MGEPQNETKEAKKLTSPMTYGDIVEVARTAWRTFRETYPRYTLFLSPKQYQIYMDEYERVIRKDTDEVLFSNGGMAFGL